MTASVVTASATTSAPADPASISAAPAAAGPTLAQTRIGERHVVAAVTPPAAAPHWARWLEEIGFLPGEQVMLMARAALGGDPLVVRVGQSTFALRRAEADCIRLRPAA